jgi:hypothetical protein
MVSVHLFGKERPKEGSDTINSLSRLRRSVRPCRKQVPHRPGIAPALGLRAGDSRSILSQTAVYPKGGSIMEPRKIEKPVESRSEVQTSPPRQRERKRRFQVIKLEERIAPCCGGGHSKGEGCVTRGAACCG